MLCVVSALAGKPPVRQPEPVPAGKVLTLADCIGLALRNEPAVRRAAAQVEVQSGLVRQARSRLLPDTSVASSTDLRDTEQSSGTSATVGASQLIYDFSRSRWQLTQSERQYAASVAALGTTKADVILGVKQSYYGLLRSAHLVQVFDQNLKAREEHVAMAQARKDAGVAPKSDILTAAAAAASARVGLVVARNDSAQARVDLNAAMGVDVRSSTQIEETAELDTPIPETDRAVDVALKNRPEMREAEEQVAADEASLKSAETGNLPELSTSLSDSQSFGRRSGGFDGASGDSNTWAWMLSLNWHPFDSGYTRGAVTQARAQLVSAQESLYQVRQQVMRDVVAARLNVVAAQEALIAATAEVESAKEDEDAATGRYQTGTGIFLEVLDAQAAYLKAQVDEAVARYGLSIARAALEHAIGATSAEGTPR